MRSSGIRYLWPYVAGRWDWLFKVVAYAVIGATASAFSPFVLGKAVDELGGGVRLSVLALYSAGILVLAAILAVFRYKLRMFTGEIAADVTYRMSQDMFAKLTALDQRNYAYYGTGDLLSRATSDIIPVWRFFSAGFQMLSHALVLLVIGVVLMARASVLLAGIVLAGLLIVIAAQVLLGPLLERASERVQRDISEMSTFSQEHLTTIRMIKAYGQEEQTVRAFETSNQNLARSNLRFMVLSGVISPVPGSVVRLTAALVLGIGGALVIENALTAGQLVEFIVYLTLLSTAAMQISSAFLRMLQGAASAGRVGEVLHHEPHVRNAPDAVKIPIRGDVAMENVTVRAKGATILKDVSFSVPAGTTVGVVGPTGAGKSTLLRLVARVQDPSAGRVLIDGMDARTLDLGCLRGAVATVPQESFLFGMSLRDNVTLGLQDVPEETLDRAITTARLSNDMPQFPRGLDTLVGERGATLSGGQKQRTAIARALVRDPRILILDDAMASVDARTASQIVEGLAQGAAGRRTTFIVTQHLPAIRHADYILVLDRGEIVERGAHAELLARGGLYAAMYAREHDGRADAANGWVREPQEVRA